MTPAFDAITPHPEGVDAADELIHERAYVVRAYRSGVDKMILRGAVLDQKPPGLYFDDTQPLTVHHMIVDLTIAIPSLEIIAAKAVLEIHPHSTCKRIEDHYDDLVGLSIARGFTRKIRELFGGPREKSLGVLPQAPALPYPGGKTNNGQAVLAANTAHQMPRRIRYGGCAWHSLKPAAPAKCRALRISRHQLEFDC